MNSLVTERRNFAMRLRQTIGAMHKASRILSECQFHMAGCADEIERLTKENKRLQRKLKEKTK